MNTTLHIGFAYFELVVAILLFLAAYFCGIVGKETATKRWWLSGFAGGSFFLALLEAGYTIFPLASAAPKGETFPILMQIILFACYVGGSCMILAGISWLLGQPTYYVGRTICGAIRIAYRARTTETDKAEETTD